jgi:adenylosuccinate synthase
MQEMEENRMEPIREGFFDILWGDGGKAKHADEAAARGMARDDGKRTVVARFQGGPNAGHTIYVRMPHGKLKKVVTHAIASGIASGADIAHGPDFALDTEKFVTELAGAQKLFDYKGRVMISERTGILFDYHRRLDGWREGRRINRVGTTLSGIGPFYEDIARRTTRVTFADYIGKNFHDKLQSVLNEKSPELVAAGILTPSYLDELVAVHDPIRTEIASFAERLEYRLWEYLDGGHHIVIEGAQGLGLDVTHGTIPDQTASHLLSYDAFGSLGLPREAFKIIGVEKAYPTRVGNGDMPTLNGTMSEAGQKAGEWGATTGRKRRAGQPDWVYVKRAARLMGCDEIALTRGDCVQDVEITPATAYIVDGVETPEVPLKLAGVEPVYGKAYEWKLWDGPRDVSDPSIVDSELCEHRQRYVAQGFESLPDGLRNYVQDHDAFVGVPTSQVGIGAVRGETVRREIH